MKSNWELKLKRAMKAWGIKDSEQIYAITENVRGLLGEAKQEAFDEVLELSEGWDCASCNLQEEIKLMVKLSER